MISRQIRGFVCIALLALLMASFGWRDSPLLVGTVRDADGVVAGARVRWQGSSDVRLSNASGRFRIAHSRDDRPLTAWKEGYRIASFHPVPKRPLLVFSRLPAEDNPAYAWLAPDPDSLAPNACGNCHTTIHDEWAGSAHARSATNPRLLSLITGIDSAGKHHARWNLSEEHPLGVGVCSRCHAPTYRSPDLDYDLRKVAGVASRGVHCDLCHKIVDVPTDKLGIRFGIDGLTLSRPQVDDLLSFGPLEDAVRKGESFGRLSLYKESRYCASCHEGTLFGVKVYRTFSEWRESPAAKRGVQCQQCHMTPTGTLTNIAPGKGGIERDPSTLAGHATPGASPAMLKKCIQSEVRLERLSDRLRVRVRIRAEYVGHRVPTGFIDRHMLLLVEGWDDAEHEVAIIAGDKLPPKLGDPWAGRAGFIYGRWLSDEKGHAPLPFWIPPHGEHDTRLWPEKTDERIFDFPPQAEKVRVRLIYRKFWPEVIQSRGWDDQQFVIFDTGL